MIQLNILLTFFRSYYYFWRSCSISIHPVSQFSIIGIADLKPVVCLFDSTQIVNLDSRGEINQLKSIFSPIYSTMLQNRVSLLNSQDYWLNITLTNGYNNNLNLWLTKVNQLIIYFYLTFLWKKSVYAFLTQMMADIA